MSVKLLAEHHLEVISLKGGCTGLSESTLVKMLHCWKSHVAAQIMTVHYGHGRVPTTFELTARHKRSLHMQTPLVKVIMDFLFELERTHAFPKITL